MCVCVSEKEREGKKNHIQVEVMRDQKELREKPDFTR